MKTRLFLTATCIFYSGFTSNAYGYGSWFLTVENNSDHSYGIQISEPDTVCWAFYDDLKKKQWIEAHSSRTFETYERNPIFCWFDQPFVTFYGFMPDLQGSYINTFSFHNMLDTYWNISTEQPNRKGKTNMFGNPYKYKNNAYFTMTVDSNGYIDIFQQ